MPPLEIVIIPEELSVTHSQTVNYYKSRRDLQEMENLCYIKFMIASKTKWVKQVKSIHLQCRGQAPYVSYSVLLVLMAVNKVARDEG